MVDLGKRQRMLRLQSFVDPNADSAYYPWGEEYESRPEEQKKFATYFRDGATMIDYARNRYYSSTLGRFLTADPYRNSAGPGDPGSWNRYAYVGDDPVNRNDPTGLDPNPEAPPDYFGSGGGGNCGSGWETDASLSGPCNSDPLGCFAEGFNPVPNPLCYGVIPPPPPPRRARQEPQCFAQLKDRPVNDPTAKKFSGVHTFWWVQGDISGVTEQFIISAGPQSPKGSTTEYLNAWATPGNNNGSGDNSRQHLDWNSGLSSTLCTQVDDMIEVAQNFPNWQILYRPAGALGFGGPNSNSASHYFAIAGEFFNVTPPLTAYGWYSLVPIP